MSHSEHDLPNDGRQEAQPEDYRDDSQDAIRLCPARRSGQAPQLHILDHFLAATP